MGMFFDLEPTLVLVAFAAGLVSIMSPCVLPLVPVYVTYLTGGTPELFERPSRADRLRAFANALLFVVGFSLVFVALGLSASAIGENLRAHGPLLRKLSGLLIIMFGLYMLGAFRWLMMVGEVRFPFRAVRPGPLASLVLGGTFGFGWTPCIGPVLTSILLLAGNTETVAQGGYLLGMYSAGLALPFLAMAVGLTSVTGLLKVLRPFLPRIQQAGGALLVLLGVLILLNMFTVINSYVRWPF